MAVHLQLHKNQAIGDHLDWNTERCAICGKTIRRPRSVSLGSQARGQQNRNCGASYGSQEKLHWVFSPRSLRLPDFDSLVSILLASEFLVFCGKFSSNLSLSLEFSNYLSRELPRMHASCCSLVTFVAEFGFSVAPPR